MDSLVRTLEPGDKRLLMDSLLEDNQRMGPAELQEIELRRQQELDLEKIKVESAKLAKREEAMRKESQAYAEERERLENIMSSRQKL